MRKVDSRTEDDFAAMEDFRATIKKALDEANRLETRLRYRALSDLCPDQRANAADLRGILERIQVMERTLNESFIFA